MNYSLRRILDQVSLPVSAELKALSQSDYEFILEATDLLKNQPALITLQEKGIQGKAEYLYYFLTALPVPSLKEVRRSIAFLCEALRLVNEEGEVEKIGRGISKIATLDTTIIVCHKYIPPHKVYELCHNLYRRHELENLVILAPHKYNLSFAGQTIYSVKKR